MCVDIFHSGALQFTTNRLWVSVEACLCVMLKKSKSFLKRAEKYPVQGFLKTIWQQTKRRRFFGKTQRGTVPRFGSVRLVLLVVVVVVVLVLVLVLVWGFLFGKRMQNSIQNIQDHIIEHFFQGWLFQFSRPPFFPWSLQISIFEKVSTHKYCDFDPAKCVLHKLRLGFRLVSTAAFCCRSCGGFLEVKDGVEYRAGQGATEGSFCLVIMGI